MDVQACLDALWFVFHRAAYAGTEAEVDATHMAQSNFLACDAADILVLSGNRRSEGMCFSARQADLSARVERSLQH